MVNTKRVLEWYEKKGDRLVGEEQLMEIGIEDIRKIFGIPDPLESHKFSQEHAENYDPCMYYVYAVNKEEIAMALQQYIKHDIKLDKYDYFIAAYEA